MDQISARLDDSIRLLTHGLRSAPQRHETLRATIEWSVQLLSEQERLLFRRLAVFAGGWTLEAAEAVCSENELNTADILDVLTHLVNKSLVIVERQVGDRRYPRAGSNRYHSLETIRQYARERLIEHAEAESLQDKHLNYFLKLSEEIEPYLLEDGQSE